MYKRIHRIRQNRSIKRKSKLTIDNLNFFLQTKITLCAAFDWRMFIFSTLLALKLMMLPMQRFECRWRKVPAGAVVVPCWLVWELTQSSSETHTSLFSPTFGHKPRWFSFSFAFFHTTSLFAWFIYCVLAAHRLALTLLSHLRILTEDFLYVCLCVVYPSIVRQISCVNGWRGRRLLCTRMCLFINQSAFNSSKLTHLHVNNETLQQLSLMNAFLSLWTYSGRAVCVISQTMPN